MKKSILASSVAAAMFGLCATGAQAAISATSTGIGDILIVPYYTAASNNATLLSITNTDTANGKAVKVRFRGAVNSDDVLDFQVFLSPTDVWTAMVSKDATTGRAKLTTSDLSCTKPSTLTNSLFQTVRLDNALTATQKANGTLEGYIEIIGMADIPKTSSTFNVIQTSTTDTTNPLWTAIKHVKGAQPPCTTSSAFTALDATTGTRLTNTVATLNASNTAAASGNTGTAAALGLTTSTGGLMADWTIINTVNSAAYAGQAYSFADDGTATVAGTKLINYWVQKADPLTPAEAAAYSADPLFLTGDLVQTYNKSTQTLNAVGVSTITAPVTPARVDLPDVSTPFNSGHASPTAAMIEMQTALGADSVLAQYATESAINGSTDWQFTMPTRRYAVALAYDKITSTDDGRRFNAAYQSAVSTSVFNAFNTSVVAPNTICVTGSAPKAYDREEQTSSSGVVISPQVLGQVLFCGEASVLAWNNGSVSTALGSQLTVYPVDVPYSAGWATMNTQTKANNSSTTVKLPFIGGAFMKATNGAQGYGVYQAYR